MSGALLTIAAACLGASPADASKTADAPAVDALAAGGIFDTSRAIIAGTNCQPGNVSVTASGGQLRVTFSSLQLALGSGDPTTTGFGACSVRVPYQLPAGYRIASVNHRLRYGVDKTASASGAVVASSLISASPAGGISVQLPAGSAMADPALVAERRSGFAGPASCSGPEGIFGINVNLSARKDTAGDAIIMAVTGLEVDLELAPCS
jgi:hypothetical protein